MTKRRNDQQKYQFNVGFIRRKNRSIKPTGCIFYTHKSSLRNSHMLIKIAISFFFLSFFSNSFLSNDNPQLISHFNFPLNSLLSDFPMKWYLNDLSTKQIGSNLQGREAFLSGCCRQHGYHQQQSEWCRRAFNKTKLFFILLF